MKIGVLGLQGAFREHVNSLYRLGVETVCVRYPSQLDDLWGLIIPGGESTVIGKLMAKCHLIEEVRKKAANGLPIWGTCAGLILLAREIEGSIQPVLRLMDIRVRRNAFGRQKHSFVSELQVKGLPGKESFPGVFIRAPEIISTGSGVEILSMYEDRIVSCSQGPLLVTSFHPELTGDLGFHKLFLSMADSYCSQVAV